MNFEYDLEKFQTNALSMDYYQVPWDTEILERPVAEIKNIRVHDPGLAKEDFKRFTAWCNERAIAFCSCRLGHDDILESFFLQSQGYIFIELNYHPEINGLIDMELAEDEFIIDSASAEDRSFLSEMAGSMFKHGRFHQDPMLGPKTGNRRYRTWMQNAFELKHQQVFKCTRRGEMIAFFVAEFPQRSHCFWSLIGLAPQAQGKGLAKRVWRSMMLKLRRDGVDTITTSITSHNVAVMNLYVSLGFRFPIPYATFHWHSRN